MPPTGADTISNTQGEPPLIRNALTGSLLGVVGVVALAVPGAVYMSNVRRPVVQPVEYVTVPGPTVTVPGPTVTVTATEKKTSRERVTEQVTVADPEFETSLLAPDPATARAFVRALFLDCVGRPPTADDLAKGSDVYMKAYREGNDAEARTREWLHAAWGAAIDSTNDKTREGRRDFC